MFHFVAEEAAESIVFPTSPTTHSLFNKFHVPAHISQYLKSFQIDAIHFLYTHYVSHEFCILNDESGLGKSATVAVFLGAVGKHKKSLIIVQNDDEMIAGWRFHFDVLTKLSTTIIADGVKDSSTSHHNIYIAKWSTLRSIADIRKYNFDIVIIDNRGQMLSNNFCTSMLIKNFEKRVNIVISSVDVTSDLKLLHNILRLGGGRLDAQYESYTAFEGRFKLPDSKDVMNKKCSLEEYFLKREILSDYCKDFRLRRYCHQYDQQLPLVDSDRYKINLDLWLTTNGTISSTCNNAYKTAQNFNGTSVSSDKGTEELFEQELVNLSKKLTEQIKSDGGNKGAVGDDHLEHNTFDIIDICDEPIMSPLLFVSESEEDEERNLNVEEEDTEEVEIVEKTAKNINNTDVFEFVDLSSESIEDGENNQHISYASLRNPTKGGSEGNAQNVSYTSLGKTANDNSFAENKTKSDKKNVKECEKSVDISSESTDGGENIQNISYTSLQISNNHNPEESKTTPENNNVRSRSKQNVTNESKERDHIRNAKNKKKENVAACSKTVENKEESNRHATRSSNENNQEKKVGKFKDRKSSESKNVSIENIEKNMNGKSENINENNRPATRSRNNGVNNLTSKPKSLVKVKNSKAESNCNLLKLNKRKSNECESNIQTHKRPLRTSTKQPVDKSENKKDITSKQERVTPPKTPTTPKRGIRTMFKFPTGIHTKETRGMQRVTRSSKSSKYVRTDLALDIDKKPVKSNKKNKQIAVKTTVKRKSSNERSVKNVKIDKGLHGNVNENSTKILKQKDKSSTKNKPTKENTIAKEPSTKSSQISVISREYEDIECGQKLLHDSDNSDKAVNEFLVPPTPPIPYISARNSQYPTMFSSLSSSSCLVEPSDVAFIPNAKTTKTQDQVIVLTSSQDDCSSSSAASQSSQSRRTRALKQGKSAQSYFAVNKRVNNNKLPVFGELLAKQTKSKSPDLFSACSDIGITCTQANNNQTSFDGFKIFGSEVKQFQQQHALSATKRITTAKTITRERSCLDILEKMFEPKTANGKKNVNSQPAPAKKTASAKTPILPTLPNDVTTAQTQQQHANKEKKSSKRKVPIVDDAIFEITNNDTFGSVMRINSSGDISPVQQQQQLKSIQISQHNKITNYLIGSTQPQTPSGEDEQQVHGTPSKRSQLSGATIAMRKSPKSKTTQTTKLTKWFLRNTATVANEKRNTPTSTSEDTTPKVTNSLKITRSTTSVKRRRLDLKNV